MSKVIYQGPLSPGVQISDPAGLRSGVYAPKGGPAVDVPVEWLPALLAGDFTAADDEANTYVPPPTQTYGDVLVRQSDGRLVDSRRVEIPIAFKTQLDPSSSLAQGGYPVVGFDPATSVSTVVDCNVNQFGLSWVSNPGAAFYDGYLFLGVDGNRAGGTVEGASGQKISVLRAADEVTWEDLGEPFNAITDTAAHFQPNLFVAGGKLQVWFTVGNSVYRGSKTSADSAWTIRRLEYQGNKPVLSSTINGAAAAGNSLTATVDGMSDLVTFAPSEPIRLADGRIAMPLTLSSLGTVDPNAPIWENAQVRRWKINVVIYSADEGETWTMSEPVRPGAGLFPFTQWEPFLQQAANGDIRMYGRVRRSITGNDSTQQVAVSRDGYAWSTTRVTQLEVASQRSHALKIGPSRWVMPHSDAPAKLEGGSITVGDRFNGSLFFNRRGDDGWTAGVSLGDLKANFVYPTMVVDGADALVFWARDMPNRRSLYMTRVALPTSEETAYVYPRRANEWTYYAPSLVAGSPAAWRFAGPHRLTATPQLSTAPDLTVTCWCKPDVTGQNIVIDSRDNPGVGGWVLQPNGAALRGVGMARAGSITAGLPTFTAFTFNATTRVCRMFGRQGNGSLTTTDVALRAFTFAGQPADGDTVTVEGTTFTFRVVAALAGEVAIGTDVSSTCGNLSTAITQTLATVKASKYGATGQHLLIAKSNNADPTISATSAQISTPSTIPTLNAASVVPMIGRGVVATLNLPFVGDIYDAQIWQKTMTDAEIKGIVNQTTTALGLNAETGASAPTGSPVVTLTPSSTSSDWSDIARTVRGTARLSTDAGERTLVITGESSAGMETPWQYTARTIAFKLSALPTTGEKVVIADFGSRSAPLELAILGSAPTTLTLGGQAVGTLADATSRVQTIEVIASDKGVTVGGVTVRRNALGGLRVHLGAAFPSDTLSPSKSVTFYLDRMRVSEHRAARDIDLPDPVKTSQSYQTTTSPTGALIAYIQRTTDTGARFGLTDNSGIGGGPGDGTVDTTLRRTASGQWNSSGEVLIERASGLAGLSVKRSNESTARLSISVNAVIGAGPGNADRDTFLERDTAKRWKATTSQFRAEAGLCSCDVGDITGLTSAQIDALAIFGGTTPANSTIVTGVDGASPIFLFRRAGKWHKPVAGGFAQIS